MTYSPSKTDHLIHRIRFNQLGRRQQQIADILSIEPRYWRNLRDGKKCASDTLTSRAEIMLLVHRQTAQLLRTSSISKAMATSVRRASSLDDLKVNSDELDDLLKSETLRDDYGLFGLSAAVHFAIWRLGSNLKTRTLASINDLDLAIKRWDKAAILAPSNASKTFSINARTARIYKETCVSSDTAVPTPNIDHYNAYREYAETFNSVHAWRDALEQAALLNDSTKIEQVFKLLPDVIGTISIKDQYEVLRQELQNIDNASALTGHPHFKEWDISITVSYNLKYNPKKGASA